MSRSRLSKLSGPRRMTQLTEVQVLRAENEELKLRLAEESWRTNPDRSGGAFTQQEIEEARTWR